MWRLRQAEAKAKAAAEDLGLNAMRAAVAAAAAPTQPSPMDEDNNSHPHHPNQARIYTIQRSGLLADCGHGARKEPAFGLAATTVASPGAGAEDWPKVGESRPACVSSHGRPPCG